jgi:4'-phosphopantetheinyl transferase
MNTTIEHSARPSTIELADNEVHVWRAWLELDPALLRRLEATLSGAERARAQRFIFERDRNYFIAAHGILRDLLGTYLYCSSQSIEFVYGTQGKPAVPSRGTRFPICFNLSHSHGLALVAIGRKREIGIDVEYIRPELAGDAVARRYFSPSEIDELLGLPAENRTEGFFLCWTRKEAYVKARGEGLQFPLKSFQVSLTPGKPAALNSDDVTHWSMYSFSPHAGYVAAVVGEGNGWQLRHLEWTDAGCRPDLSA